MSRSILWHVGRRQRCVGRRRRRRPPVWRRISRRRLRHVGSNHWPTRLCRFRDRAWWNRRRVVVTERPTLAYFRHLERIVDAASAWSVDCGNAYPARYFLRHAGIEAGELGVVPPRLALGEEI